MELPVRLPAHVRPRRYQLSLEIDPRADDYRGEVVIALEIGAPTTEIALHAAGLVIDEARLDGAPLAVALEPARERVNLSRATPVSGAASLALRFRGRLQRGLRGLYKVADGHRVYALTQFEPADARRAFPCFDEPAMKATFEVTLTVPADLDALSNGAALETRGLPSGHKRIRFAETPVLSTYLVAFVVGELAAVTGQVGAVPVRVLAVPGKEHLGALALEMACAFLPILEGYFGIPYPYGKLDLVAAPDFEAGAMENAGAILFRESLLLLDGQTASLDAQRGVAITVAHEMAHQWFGNLVTMEWWDDLWLNEAFATWMEFRVVDVWRPGWQLWTDFERMKATPLHLDSLQSTRPIQAAVRSPEQANEMFDGITYNKGAAVLRMFEIFLGEDVFREGVRGYLKAHAGQNAQASALWAALAQASGQPVAALAKSWFERPGYPLLSIAVEGSRARVSQRRFFAKAGYTEAAAPWALPLALVSRDAKTGQLVRVTKLLEAAEGELTLPGPLVFGNAQGSGFYRVAYDPAALGQLLASAGDLVPVERVSLLADQWAQVRAGAPLRAHLGLLDRLGRDSQRTVLETAIAQLSTLDDVVLADPARAAFQPWVRELLGPQQAALGLDPKPAEGPEAELLRPRLVDALGRLGGHAGLLAELSARIRRWLAGEPALPHALVGVALRLEARGGDSKLWEAFLSRMRGAIAPEEHDRFLAALASFEAPELVARTLGLALSEDVRSQDLQILFGQLFGNRQARGATWRYLTSNWPAVSRKAPVFGLRRILGATAALVDERWRAEVAAFFEDPAHHVEAGERELKQALEAIDLALGLRARERENLGSWLRERG